MRKRLLSLGLTGLVLAISCNKPFQKEVDIGIRRYNSKRLKESFAEDKPSIIKKEYEPSVVEEGKLINSYKTKDSEKRISQ